MLDSNVVILDNGGGTCKIGIGGDEKPRSIFPNCTAKPKGERQTYVGDALLDAKDILQLNLRRPFDRGFLVNWDVEKEVWNRAFKSVLKVNPRNSCLLVTEPLFNFAQLQQTLEQVVFEEYGFQALYNAPAPVFSMRHQSMLHPEIPGASCCSGVVLDAGFSFTHAVPIIDGKVLYQGVKRINIGGKAMTNYLKELVSYRSLNMMEETYLMEHIKDQLTFVSLDVKADMKLSQQGMKSPYRKEYVLPDGVHNLRGYVKEPEEGPATKSAKGPPSSNDAQTLLLNNERFLVPELLFHPSDVGLDQAGLHEAVVQSVQACHVGMQPLLYSNIVCSGGLMCCPNTRERLVAELRPLVPDDYDMRVTMPEDPITMAWHGMNDFVTSGEFASVAVTKAQYEEQGYTRRSKMQRMTVTDDDDDD